MRNVTQDRGSRLDPNSRIFSDIEAKALQSAFLLLSEKWQLTSDEVESLFGGMPTNTIQNSEQLCRMSNLVSIHRALKYIFRDPDRAYGWVKRPNAAFDGATALEVMLAEGIDGILRVRRYLDAVAVHG